MHNLQELLARPMSIGFHFVDIELTYYIIMETIEDIKCTEYLQNNRNREKKKQ